LLGISDTARMTAHRVRTRFKNKTAWRGDGAELHDIANESGGIESARRPHQSALPPSARKSAPDMSRRRALPAQHVEATECGPPLQRRNIRFTQDRRLANATRRLTLPEFQTNASPNRALSLRGMASLRRASCCAAHDRIAGFVRRGARMADSHLCAGGVGLAERFAPAFGAPR
jgi:hypothetical protein